MQPQKKKSHTVVLLIGWLIILGSYLLIRLAFILFGLLLRCILENTANHKRLGFTRWAFYSRPLLRK